MSTILALVLLQAAPISDRPSVPPLTVPRVSVQVDGKPTTLDSQLRKATPDSITVDYSSTRKVVTAVLEDGTDGVIPMSVPGIAYDQPLAYRDRTSGEVRIMPALTEHREPVVVPVQANARGAYVVLAQPRNEAERLVGVCDRAGPAIRKER